MGQGSFTSGPAPESRSIENAEDGKPLGKVVGIMNVLLCSLAVVLMAISLRVLFFTVAINSDKNQRRKDFSEKIELEMLII